MFYWCAKLFLDDVYIGGNLDERGEVCFVMGVVLLCVFDWPLFVLCKIGPFLFACFLKSFWMGVWGVGSMMTKNLFTHKSVLWYGKDITI